MSKIILLLILLTASQVIFGSETVIVLKEFGRRGERGSQETVIAGNNYLMVNAQKLNPSEIITQSEHIRIISQFKKKFTGVQNFSNSTCDTGRFEHILKKGTQLKKETGCVGSDRYRELKTSFKALAKDPLSQK